MNNFVDTAELIDRFRTFAGVERYRKFLYVTNTTAVHKRRLLHWQEQLWQAFCDDHPKHVHLTSDELLALFRICHIHEQQLMKPDSVQQTIGLLRLIIARYIMGTCLQKPRSSSNVACDSSCQCSDGGDSFCRR